MKIAFCGHWRHGAEVQGNERWQAELLPPESEARVAVVAARTDGALAVTWYHDVKEAKRQAQQLLSRGGESIWAMSIEHMPEPGGYFVRK